MCLAQGPQHSDTGEALTRGPSVSSQALHELPWFYQLAVPTVWRLITKVKVPAGPWSWRWGGGGGGGGQWLQMTIVHNNYYKQLRLGSNKIYIYRSCYDNVNFETLGGNCI